MCLVGIVADAVPDWIEAPVKLGHTDISRCWFAEAFEKGIHDLLAIDREIHRKAHTLVRGRARLQPVARQEQTWDSGCFGLPQLVTILITQRDCVVVGDTNDIRFAAAEGRLAHGLQRQLGRRFTAADQIGDRNG